MAEENESGEPSQSGGKWGMANAYREIPEPLMWVGIGGTSEENSASTARFFYNNVDHGWWREFLSECNQLDKEGDKCHGKRW